MTLTTELVNPTTGRVSPLQVALARQESERLRREARALLPPVCAQCGSTTDVRQFMNFKACPEHTPARLAGHPEPKHDPMPRRRPGVAPQRTAYGR